jgi:exopolyphosphatase/guanosine-5'-triphosphate,3'-diphosphate pyrophosphatase
MEKFVSDPTQPFSADAERRIVAHTRDVIARANFTHSLPASAVAVGTGGTVTTVRTIFGARAGKPFEATSPNITIGELRELLTWLGALPLAERKQVPGLPPGRADVFPVALATLITIAEIGRFATYQNSIYNLRYGIADEALPSL